MPNNCGWTESNDPACLLDAPAEIDVVPRLAIFGIEAAHAFECPAIKRHVTAGNVLGDCISKQDMTRSAGRRCDARLNPILRGWRNVRSADSGVIAAYKRADEIIEPIGICHAVRIRIGKHFAFGSNGPRVTSVT